MTRGRNSARALGVRWVQLLVVACALWSAPLAEAQVTNYRSIGTAGDYTAPGTLAATNGSAVVNGSGTTWLASNRGRGDRIEIDSTDYTIFRVLSDTLLILTSPFTGTTGPGKAHTISRQYTTLQDWEDCISWQGGGGSCTYFGASVTSANLISDNRVEVGIAYADSDFTPAARVDFQGSTTDATHTITLTADGINRHNGTAGAGGVIDAQNTVNSIEIRDSYVTLEWLEVIRVRGLDNWGAVTILGTFGDLATNVLLQNLLIHDFLDATAGIDISGIRMSGDDVGKSATIRNTMTWDGDRYGIEGDNASDTMLVENCSIDNMQDPVESNGVAADVSTITVKNTIVTRSNNGTGLDFNPALGSFDPASSNNTDSDGSAPGANPQTSTAAALFVTPNADLHLLATAVAVDTGLDLSSSFSIDVDNDSRGAQWDRGADEIAATAVYRSVGINGTDLNTAPRTVVISGTTATFSGSMPNNVGVGDVLTYSSGENQLAFIVGRTTPTVFAVTDKDGGTPTAVSGVTPGVYRAYTSLANWESQTENPNITEPAEDDVNPLPDLVSGNTVMMVPCYGDGEDAASVDIRAWTTGPDNYIKIYTPTSPSQVGTSQRHDGKWSTSAYRISNTLNTDQVILVRERYVRIDGIQVDFQKAPGTTRIWGILVRDDNADAAAEFHLSNNIVRQTYGTPATDAATGILALDNFVGTVPADNADYVAKVWNNIVYGFLGVARALPISADNYGTIYGDVPPDVEFGVAAAPWPA